jgi:hypothetical protein
MFIRACTAAGFSKPAGSLNTAVGAALHQDTARLTQCTEEVLASGPLRAMTPHPLFRANSWQTVSQHGVSSINFPCCCLVKIVRAGGAQQERNPCVTYSIRQPFQQLLC